MTIGAGSWVSSASVSDCSAPKSAAAAAGRFFAEPGVGFTAAAGFLIEGLAASASVRSTAGVEPTAAVEEAEGEATGTKGPLSSSSDKSVTLLPTGMAATNLMWQITWQASAKNNFQFQCCSE